ncbi:porin [Rhizobium sp. L1K21]|uniref:porin n=1 Tax=Rhizobium sp. L1K21 TaxID=2954933 RepID=UPI002092C248|nr:porin [Rhizobium sp. L1K21]MCO6186632.1 porin [Rhizobium sp. L1K21]
MNRLRDVCVTFAQQLIGKNIKLAARNAFGDCVTESVLYFQLRKQRRKRTPSKETLGMGRECWPSANTQTQHNFDWRSHMTIKSLLLGSAAALAAVSGAQAADAIVAAEPEPMEYVKVCDAYGDGYFYIPGTETCLAISGFLRYDGEYTFGPKDYTSQFRARIQLDAKNDSEYGTVYSRIRFEPQSTNNGRMTDATRGTQGYMGIGGLELGLYDRQWHRFFGYGGYNTIYDGAYGYNLGQYVSYSADLGGVSFIANADFTGVPNKAGVFGAVKGSFGPASAVFGVAYDSAVKAFTVKGALEAEFSPVTAKVQVSYTDKNGSLYQAGYGFFILGSLKANVTDDVVAYTTATWSEKPSKNYGVSAGLTWNVASGFAISGEYSHARTAGAHSNAVALRVQRSF